MQRKIVRVTAVLCVALFVYFIIRANPRELLRVLGHLAWAEIAVLTIRRTRIAELVEEERAG